MLYSISKFCLVSIFSSESLFFHSIMKYMLLHLNFSWFQIFFFRISPFSLYYEILCYYIVSILNWVTDLNQKLCKRIKKGQPSQNVTEVYIPDTPIACILMKGLKWW